MCDDQWSAQEADVVCKQLGFPNGTFDKDSTWSRPEDDSFSMLFSVECKGTEDTIQNCQSEVETSDETTDRCRPDDIAGVYCYNTTSYERGR